MAWNEDETKEKFNKVTEITTEPELMGYLTSNENYYKVEIRKLDEFDVLTIAQIEEANKLKTAYYKLLEEVKGKNEIAFGAAIEGEKNGFWGIIINKADVTVEIRLTAAKNIVAGAGGDEGKKKHALDVIKESCESKDEPTQKVALPVLEELCKNPDVQDKAFEVLKQVCGNADSKVKVSAIGVLKDLCKDDSNPDAQEKAFEVLKQVCGDAEPKVKGNAIGVLKDLCKDDSNLDRQKKAFGVLEDLSKTDNEVAVTHLKYLCEDIRKEVYEQAFAVLEKVCNSTETVRKDRAFAVLKGKCNDINEQDKALPVLKVLFKSKNAGVYDKAFGVLKEVCENTNAGVKNKAFENLEEWCKDTDTQENALKVLKELYVSQDGKQQVSETLRNLCRDNSTQEKAAAVLKDLCTNIDDKVKGAAFSDFKYLCNSGLSDTGSYFLGELKGLCESKDADALRTLKDLSKFGNDKALEVLKDFCMDTSGIKENALDALKEVANEQVRLLTRSIDGAKDNKKKTIENSKGKFEGLTDLDTGDFNELKKPNVASAWGKLAGKTEKELSVLSNPNVKVIKELADKKEKDFTNEDKSNFNALNKEDKKLLKKLTKEDKNLLKNLSNEEINAYNAADKEFLKKISKEQIKAFNKLEGDEKTTLEGIAGHNTAIYNKSKEREEKIKDFGTNLGDDWTKDKGHAFTKSRQEFFNAKFNKDPSVDNLKEYCDISTQLINEINQAEIKMQGEFDTSELIDYRKKVGHEKDDLHEGKLESIKNHELALKDLSLNGDDKVKAVAKDQLKAFQEEMAEKILLTEGEKREYEEKVKVKVDAYEYEQAYKENDAKKKAYQSAKSPEDKFNKLADYLSDKSVIENLSKKEQQSLDALDERVNRAKKYREEARVAIDEKLTKAGITKKAAEKVNSENDFDNLSEKVDKLIKEEDKKADELLDFLNEGRKEGEKFKKEDLENIEKDGSNIKKAFDGNEKKTLAKTRLKNWQKAKVNLDAVVADKVIDVVAKLKKLKKDPNNILIDIDNNEKATEDVAKAIGQREKKLAKAIKEYEKKAKVIINEEQKKIAIAEDGGFSRSGYKISKKDLEEKLKRATERKDLMEKRAEWDFTGISEWRRKRLEEREAKLAGRIDKREKEITLRGERIEKVKEGTEELNNNHETYKAENLNELIKANPKLLNKILEDPDVPDAVRKKIAKDNKKDVTVIDNIGNFTMRMRKRIGRAGGHIPTYNQNAKKKDGLVR